MQNALLTPTAAALKTSHVAVRRQLRHEMRSMRGVQTAGPPSPPALLTVRDADELGARVKKVRFNACQLSE